MSENMNSTNEYIDEQWTVQAQLTSATNLQLTRNANATAINVAWQVIQIASAAVQSAPQALPSMRPRLRQPLTRQST